MDRYIYINIYNKLITIEFLYKKKRS
jgi:hypothetical protein